MAFGWRVGLLCGVLLLLGSFWLVPPSRAATTPPPAAPAAFTKGPPIATAPGVPAAPAGTGGAADPGGKTPLEQMQDIRDIQPPVTYGWDPRWLVGGAGALLVVAAVGLLWWLLRRRRRPAPATPAAASVPPEEVAREELAALAREAGLGDKEFYFRLCTAVRRFLDGRFGADTLECTTEELLPVLRHLPLGETARGALVTLFRHADPIRYADGSAPGERRRADLTAAQELLRVPTAGEGS